MNRAPAHRPVDLDAFPWRATSCAGERAPLPIDRDTRTLLARALHARAVPVQSGEPHEPPRARPRRPAARTWRAVRAARYTIEARLDRRAEGRATVARRDRLAGCVGLIVGALLGLVALRSAGSYAFHAEWLVATLPLVTLWASVGGLVGISITRAARGEDPFPELVGRTPLGERRSLARPVALGLVIGGMVIAALRIAIALSAWLPVVRQS